jgi:predicted regulator of Ras-like GTPase activity (Roadblock/LC7/MglB family)
MSSEGMNTSLATLKDVAGIAGSFVCTQDGRLLSRDIAAVFDDDVLAEAGSRLCRVKEAFAAGGDDLESGVMRFGDHKVFLKSVGSSMLCILAEGGINMPALRMAANLVGRRIAADVARGESEAPPVRVPASAQSPETSRTRRPTQPLAPPGMRRFRGRALE